jgi:DNA invertase Pin-like site-specific DNA recombinase
MKVIYARISTANQNEARQMKQQGTRVFLDVCSGKVNFAERPEGAKLLKAKDVTDIEVLDIDRLGRNLRDMLNTIQTFTDKGVNIYIKNQGLNTLVNGKPNPTATMIIQIMGSIAQFEREQTRQRCAEGIAVAKAQDKLLPKHKRKYKGKPIGTPTDIDLIRNKHAEKIQVIQSYINEGKPLNWIANEYKYNRGTIYRLIEKGLIKTKANE